MRETYHLKLLNSITKTTMSTEITLRKHAANYAIWVFAFVLLACTSSAPEQNIAGAEETKAAEEAEWVSHFNGKDIEDWIVKIHHHEVGQRNPRTTHPSSARGDGDEPRRRGVGRPVERGSRA